MNAKNSSGIFSEPYYIGVDIGTESVGYAATDTDYKPLKFKGDPMLGVTLFDPASQCDKRRAARSARRRLDRRQTRVNLIQELFCEEIAKADPMFFKRIKDSYLCKEDRPESFLCGLEWDNDEYKKKYPTIHHLILKLMNSETADECDCDVRHLYIAIAWLVAHRGHFFMDISDGNADGITDTRELYENFTEWFEENDIKAPWQCEASEFCDILSRLKGVNKKENELKALLKLSKDDEYPFEKKNLIKLFAGGTVKIKKLFTEEEYKELDGDLCLDDPEKLEEMLPLLGEREELIRRMAAVYDRAKLTELLGKHNYISELKISQYEAHKKDLADLKYIIKKYCSKEYGEMFRRNGKNDKNNNYSAYVGNFKSYKDGDEKKTCKKDDFYKFVNGKLPKIENVEEADKETVKNILDRMESSEFMEKPVNSDNRLIPHQLYLKELDMILDNAEKKFAFLSVRDENGLSVSDKIRSVFLFRVPYYVGPLVSKDKSKFAWLERKAEGKILPWNFDDMVDKDACEEEFIRRMTNKCQYLPNEDVVPQNSLLYSKFVILNAINNIKIDDKAISVEQKQKMFDEVFKKQANVSYKKIKDFFVTNYGYREESLSGIDTVYKATYKPYHDFRRLIADGVLNEEEVEKIIERLTYTEDKKRFKDWLKSWASENHKAISDDDIKYIASKKYSGFGKLSRKFLNGIEGISLENGEVGTVMHFLWNTNDNLMQIIADKTKYNFAEILENERREYYSQKSGDINEILEDMGISNAVKRPIIRTLDIVSDIVKIKKYPPKKIFVEMSRGEEDESKKTRKRSRKDQLLSLYEGLDENEINDIKQELEGKEDRKLQSEALYLYFAQLGKCMYCGKALDDLGRCDIDHIWPQSLTKDDSIHNNKVLVCKEENGLKSDKYPLPSEWRTRMRGFWDKLKKDKLINDEKYNRLTRQTPFTEKDKEGFINRQLVETRQSTKGVCEILKQKYDGTNIVYVKAGRVSDFRHNYGDIKNKAFKLHLSNEERNELSFVKSRSANDIHHAYDAYLNIVVGNVYDEKFSKHFF